LCRMEGFVARDRVPANDPGLGHTDHLNLTACLGRGDRPRHGVGGCCYRRAAVQPMCRRSDPRLPGAGSDYSCRFALNRGEAWGTSRRSP
jgi:hypothetical protein